MERYTRIEFIVLMVMLFLNVVFVIAIIGFGGFSGLVVSNDEQIHPKDYIHDDQIKFEEGEIIIEIEDPVLSRYEDTGSMEPVLGVGATGIGFKPKEPTEIGVGDIISFRKDGVLLVHRVIEKGEDDLGFYFVTRGDNNHFDDGKIRFGQVNSVLVGVLY